MKETWLGKQELPFSLGKEANSYLYELREKLEVAQLFAREHAQQTQQRYATRYNFRSRDKHFEFGEKCLILTPDSTSSKVFSKWKEPVEVIEIRSPYSYLIELNYSCFLVHANKLRKYHVRIHEVICENIEQLQCEKDATCNGCAVIHERDVDFGSIDIIEIPIVDSQQIGLQRLPSEKIDESALAHLSTYEKRELLNVLDRYPERFSDVPGLCDVVYHDVPLSADFKPKRLKAYCVLEHLKAEVDQHINDLLNLGFIKKSKSEMASP